ncbi:hypothetical protein D6833_11820 [Candidatus Parcubacteria bacterium]|nr:MAG: hypothetical protein D6833_11820 [Candidatus Parcubacteria bacterium]
MLEWIRALGDIIAALFEVSAHSFAQLSARLARVQRGNLTTAALYLASLRRLAAIVVLLPIPLLLLGILPNAEALAAIAGLVWVAATLVLAFIAAPLGMIVDAALHVTRQSPRGVGARYVNLVLWMLLIESSVALFLSVVPLYRNLVALPIFFLAMGVLGILAILGKKERAFRKWAQRLAVMVAAAFMVSILFPQSASVLRGLRNKADAAFAKVLRGEVQLSPPHSRSTTEPAPLPAPNAVHTIILTPQHTKQHPLELNLREGEWSPWIDASYRLWEISPENPDASFVIDPLNSRPLFVGSHQSVHLEGVTVFRVQGKGKFYIWVAKK